jgi:hypothetical protein
MSVIDMRRFAAWLLVLPVPAAAQITMEELQRVNLDRLAKLPCYIVHETAKRYTSRRKTPEKWHLEDTIESEITFSGGDPVRDQLMRNGKLWRSSFDALPGVKWSAWFGDELKPLFDPKCGTVIEFAGSEGTAGSQLLTYRFHSPANGCFGYFGDGVRQYNRARSGQFSVENPAANLVRYEEVADDFPAGFMVVSYRASVSWAYVSIGDASQLLPATVEFLNHYASGDSWRIAITYTNQRHFQASSNITFQPPQPVSKKPFWALSMSGIRSSPLYAALPKAPRPTKRR